MHDDHVALGVLEKSVVDDEAVLETLVLGEVLEALLLHTGGVQDVGAGDDLGSQLLGLDDQLAGGDDLLADFLGESEGLGGHELDADIVELEQLDQGVHGAAVLEVTSEGDGQAGDGAELLTDGEEVQEGLGGVLERAVTTVDDRNLGELGGDLGAAGLGVAEDNGVTIAAESADGVLEALALLGRRVLGSNGDGASTEALHSSVEGGRGAGGGLVEESGQDTALEDVKNTVALDTEAHLLGDREEGVQIRAGELVHRQDVLSAEGGAGKSVGQSGGDLRGGGSVERRAQLADGGDGVVESPDTAGGTGGTGDRGVTVKGCLLYTSDAADEMD